MKTLKPTAAAAMARVLEEGDRPFLAPAALVAVDLATGAPLPEMDLWAMVGSEFAPADIDMGMVKPRGEVLVSGSAFAQGDPCAHTRARIQLGSIDKSLDVYGDRYWLGDRISAPRPFERIPITHAHAFGGEGHPLNPAGKGAHPVQLNGQTVHPLPNLELPGRGPRSPDDHSPVPAFFCAVDPTSPQRASRLGTYDAAWLRDRAPGFPTDLDLAYFQMGPPDQWLDGFFRGDEAYRIENMHPTKPVLAGNLPGLAARALIARQGDDAVLSDVAMHLETVHFVPHLERAILVFRGLAPIAEDDAADVTHLMLALERLGEPKPLEHYQDVLRRRLDPELGHIHSLRESDLLPEGPAARRQKSDFEKLVDGEGLLRTNMKRGAERRRAEQCATLEVEIAEGGLDRAAFAPLLDPPSGDPEDEIPETDDLAPFVERKLKEAAEEEAKAEARAVTQKAELRAAMAEIGADVDENALAGVAPGGPPTFSAAAERARFEELAEMCRNMDAPSAELEAMLVDPTFDRRLAQMEAQARDGYRHTAHHAGPAAAQSGEASQRQRAEVVARHAAGESLAARDLTGADLSGLDLRGARLREAFLESCDLRASDLSGADLRGAVLAHANLGGAVLRDADLGDANLGKANLAGAILEGALLRGAVLHRADLSGAVLVQADLTLADLSEARLGGNDFRGAVLQLLTFLSTDLRGVSFAGSDLSRCLFNECSLQAADFAGAQLTGATFVKVDASGASFRGANLTNARFVQESRLDEADLREANLKGANLRGSKLAGANLSMARAEGCDLSGCDLRGARLGGAVLRGAMLTRTDFGGADLSLADLMEAVLGKAKLGGANLFQANLFRADLLRVEIDDATRLDQANLAEARLKPRRRHAQQQ